MKKILAILLCLCSWQSFFGQEKEEYKKNKPQEQKIIKEVDGQVVLKAYQNVTVASEEKEEEEEEKEDEKTPFGVPFTRMITLSEDYVIVETFKLKVLSKKGSKDYYNSGKPISYNFSEKFTDEVIALDYKRVNKENYMIFIPPLKANRTYVIETTYVKKDDNIASVFFQMHLEGKPKYPIRKKWMKNLIKISDSQEPYGIYYWPTVKELENFKASISNFDLKNLTRNDEQRLTNLTIEKFPTLMQDVPNFEKIVQFASWISSPEYYKNGVNLTIDDTWEFLDQEKFGFGLYHDFENIYDFYEKNLREILTKDRLSQSEFYDFIKITRILKEKLEQSSTNTAEGVIPNYLQGLRTAVEEYRTNLSTYPQSFQTAYKLTVVPDFGLVAYKLGSFKNIKGTPFLGVNIAFSPSNKDAPLSLSKLTLWQRMSIHTGITLNSLEETNTREDFFNKISWMLGGSYKVGSHALRINTGGLIYNKIDAVNGNKSFAVAPYLGFSIDLEIGKWIESLIPSVGANFKK